jgi:hypothetical protein
MGVGQHAELVGRAAVAVVLADRDDRVVGLVPNAVPTANGWLSSEPGRGTRLTGSPVRVFPGLCSDWQEAGSLETGH